MQELIRVAVDAMGGDNAPAEIVKGAVEALKASTDLKVILVWKLSMQPRSSRWLNRRFRQSVRRRILQSLLP